MLLAGPEGDEKLLPCEPREYGVSETRPIHLSCKLHDPSSIARFDMHYSLEIGVVQSGQMERYYQGHRRTLGPGQVWLCSAWEPHGFRVIEGPCRIVVASVFPAALANTCFPELTRHDWHAPFVVPAARRPDVPLASRQWVVELARSLEESVTALEPRRLLLQRMFIYQLLLELPRASEPLDAEALEAEGWAYFNRAVELVLRRRCFVSTEDAARECAISQKALNALFRSATGSSFPKFALRYRLQGAASRLLESREPVKAVARDWGFADVSHFHAAFRSSYGCSPVRYREVWGRPGAA